MPSSHYFRMDICLDFINDSVVTACIPFIFLFLSQGKQKFVSRLFKMLVCCISFISFHKVSVNVCLCVYRCVCVGVCICMCRRCVWRPLLYIISKDTYCNTWHYSIQYPKTLTVTHDITFHYTRRTHGTLLTTFKAFKITRLPPPCTASYHCQTTHPKREFRHFLLSTH